jgi:hypothetical protein
MRVLATVVLGALVVTGCGNFFPNPENVVLPSGVRAYELVCGQVPHGECERRAEEIVAKWQGRPHPGAHVVRFEFQGSGDDYAITYSDGTTESVIVD